MTARKSWDEYFMEEAARVASRSKDPSRQVGAIIVRPDNTEAARGYNGFPRGVADLPERYLDKEFKSAVVLHAEENAIRSAKGEDLTGYTLYVTPYMPCAHCASWIASQGIKRVVTDMGPIPAKWQQNFEYSKIVFKECRVDLEFVGEHNQCSTSIPYNGEPHFIIVDANGENAMMCSHQSSYGGEQFIVIGIGLKSTVRLGNEGWIEPDGSVGISRGRLMSPRREGQFRTIWRGERHGSPIQLHEFICDVAQAFRGRS